MGRSYFVYIVTNRRHGTVYTGVTNDLARRTYQHRQGVHDGFTRKWGCKRLVWFEPHDDIANAILREKQIKRWLRVFKNELIEETNPEWRDLWWEIIGPQPPEGLVPPPA